MNIVTRLATYLSRYDQKELMRLLAATVLLVSLITGWLLYSYVRLQTTLIQRYEQLNKERIKTRGLIVEHERLIEQRKRVDALLEADPNFKMKPFFSGLLSSLRLNDALAREPETTPIQDLVKGYGELRLEATLKKITTQQLAELLEKLAGQERVYVKEIVVTKSNGEPFINVALTLATFERNNAV